MFLRAFFNNFRESDFDFKSLSMLIMSHISGSKMAIWITVDIVSRLVSPSGVKVKLILYDVTTAIIALLVG